MADDLDIPRHRLPEDSRYPALNQPIPFKGTRHLRSIGIGLGPGGERDPANEH